MELIYFAVHQGIMFAEFNESILSPVVRIEKIKLRFDSLLDGGA
jgi:hypothetical protein